MPNKHERDLQRALVTGSTSGIGRATAKRLAADGFDVIVHGRDAERAAATLREIETAGGRARFVAADLSQPDDVTRLSEAARDVDVLVNNGGFSWFGPTEALDIDTFDRMFAASVRATYYLVAALAPRMAARGRGRIINVGSVSGQVGVVRGAAYGATKAAVAALTRAWAAEFSPHGVLVNTLAPGPVYTAVPAERTEGFARTTLLKRAASAEEMAAIISFLASPECGYITGAVIAADGGWSPA